MTLDDLPLRQRARIATIDWNALRPADANRLRNLGFDEGVDIEKLHRAPLGSDPIACRVGRMTIAIRRAHAQAVQVRTDETGAEAEAA